MVGGAHPTCSFLRRWRDGQIAADFSGEAGFDFAVSGDRLSLACFWVSPHRVSGAFGFAFTTVLAKMLQQFGALHGSGHVRDVDLNQARRLR